LDGDRIDSPDRYRCIEAIKIVDDTLCDYGRKKNLPLLFSLRQKTLYKFFEQRARIQQAATATGNTFDEDYIKKNYKAMFQDADFSLSFNIVLAQFERDIRFEAARHVARLKATQPVISRNIGLNHEDIFSEGIGTIRNRGEGLARTGDPDNGLISGVYKALLFSPENYNYAQLREYAVTAANFAMLTLIRTSHLYHGSQIALSDNQNLENKGPNGLKARNRFTARSKRVPDSPEERVIMQEMRDTLHSLKDECTNPLSKKILEMMFEAYDQISGHVENPEEIRDKVRKAVVDQMINKKLVDRFVAALFEEEVTSDNRREAAKAINAALGVQENDEAIEQYTDSKDEFTNKLTSRIEKHEKYGPTHLGLLLKDAKEQRNLLSDDNPLINYEISAKEIDRCYENSMRSYGKALEYLQNHASRMPAFQDWTESALQRAQQTRARQC